MSADLLEAFGKQAISVSEDSTSTSASDRSKHITASNLSKQATIITQVSAAPSLLWKKDAEGTDVLFDASADDVDNEDDFGDFEGPEATTQPLQFSQLVTPDTGSTDLLDIESLVGFPRDPDTKGYPATGSNTFTDEPFGHLVDLDDVPMTTAHQTVLATQNSAFEEDWGTFEDVETGTTNSERPTITPSKPSGTLEPAVEAPEEDIDEDDWDAFEDGPAMETSTTTQQAMNTTKIKVQSSTTPPPASTPSTPQERPTNIPPPSTLLELLPTLYQNLANQSLTTPTNNNSTSPTTHQILQTYHTTSRILSGRHNRWKRDPHLLTSTLIAPSGSKGMKLQSLRPTITLTLKEDQDALEAISSWSHHSHIFRSTLLKAKIHLPTTPLSDKMVVRTVSGPGVLTAKEVCAVCGLRRNERVVGADAGVEDVFGEFWVEFWGHRDCCWFWEVVEGMLERR